MQSYLLAKSFALGAEAHSFTVVPVVAESLQPQTSVSRQRDSEEGQTWHHITTFASYHSLSAKLDAIPCIKHCERKKQLRKTQQPVTHSSNTMSQRRNHPPLLWNLTEQKGSLAASHLLFWASELGSRLLIRKNSQCPGFV